MTQAFFEQPREWSQRKHSILAAYLRSFCTALSRRAKEESGEHIYYIDCFAGAGTYSSEDGGQDIDGSPVLAARIAQELPYPIRCINIENDQKNYENLVASTRQFIGLVENRAGASDLIIDEILAQVKKSPALFFLDPYGAKDIPIRFFVDKLALRTQPTDILIRYDPVAVQRISGRAVKPLKWSLNDQENLNNLFYGNEWKSIIEKISDPQEKRFQLLHLYTSKLTSIPGSRLKYAASYPIRTVTNKLKYFLVFATGNKLGIKLMSSILYRAEEELIEDQEAEKSRRYYGDIQSPLFDLEEIEPPKPTEEELMDRKINDLRTSVSETALLRAKWTYDDLYYEMILRHGWFGRITDQQFRTALKLFEKENLLKKEGSAWSGNTRIILNRKD